MHYEFCSHSPVGKQERQTDILLASCIRACTGREERLMFAYNSAIPAISFLLFYLDVNSSKSNLQCQLYFHAAFVLCYRKSINLDARKIENGRGKSN